MTLRPNVLPRHNAFSGRHPLIVAGGSPGSGPLLVNISLYHGLDWFFFILVRNRGNFISIDENLFTGGKSQCAVTCKSISFRNVCQP